jgi:adenylate cyclase
MKAKKRRFISLTFKLTMALWTGCFFALGMITALTIKFAGDDIRVSAENTNWTLNTIRANAVNFALPPLAGAALQFFDALKPEKNINAAQETFFEEHRNIAAFAVFAGGSAGIFVNKSWAAESAVPADGIAAAEAGRLDYEAVSSFLRGSEAELRRASGGENGIYPVSGAGEGLLVYFCAVNGGAAEKPAENTGGALALFFPRSLLERCLHTAQSERNFSFAVNGQGEPLTSARDFAEDTIPGMEITQQAIQSARGLQIQYALPDGSQYLGAYTHLDEFNIAVITSIAERDINAVIIETTRRNIFTAIAALVMVAFLMALFSRRITKPLTALYNAAAGIEAGNYSLPLTVTGNDETGKLTASFIAMRNGVENFEHFTSKPLVRLARAGKLQRKGELKDAVIMFAFIRDFETLTQDLNADEAVQYINAFLERIVPIIIKGGGIIDKYLTQNGLVIMALWGTLQTQGSLADDAAAAVTTALNIRQAVKVWNLRYAEDESGDNEWRDERIIERRQIRTDPLRMGCSINLGPVVTGQMGCEKRMEHTVIGDAVNLAARVEGAVDIFDSDILITEAVHELTAGKFAVMQLTPLTAKGVSKPVIVYAVGKANTPAEAE